MRTSRIMGLAVIGLLSFTALAFALQENTYTVTGGVKPSKVGTKKKPIPVSLDFNYTVDEKSGKRPALINKYDIFFENGQVNTNLFPGCSAAKIDQDQSDVNCPKGSLMGTGNVENATGKTIDESDRSLKCHLDLKVYNARDNHAALYLHGEPAADPTDPKHCPLTVDKAIDATFVKRANGTSLVFTVDEFLLHPVTGFDNAVVQVKSNIRKATVKSKGKTRGFFESAGKCKNHKSSITVAFTQVNGTTVKESASFSCA